MVGLTTPSCWAQEARSGETAIKVTDQTGIGVPSARIRIVTTDGTVLSQEADGFGYLSVALKPGCSAVYASGQGFKTSAVYVDAPIGNNDTFVIVLHIGDSGVPFSYVHNLLVRVATMDAWLMPSDLQNMPHKSITVMDPFTSTTENYSGVTAAEVLARVQASVPKDHVIQPSGLMASGAAEYVRFTLGQQTSSLLGQAFVADSVNGHVVNKFFPFRFVITHANCPPLIVHSFDRLEFTASNH
jgi:hypothetical protein